MLAFASERKRYPAGTVIIRSGDLPGGAQVLISGAVTVSPDGEGAAKPHVVSQPGAVISAMALIVERPRQVTVEAVTVTETLFVPRVSFLKLANESPELAARAVARIRQDLFGFVSAIAPLKDKFRAD